MNNHQAISKSDPTRERMIQLLNEDLASEFQAIVAFIVYSQVLESSAYTAIARELERHAAGDFQHFKQLAKQIESLGGIPCVTRLTDKAAGEATTIRHVAPDHEPAAMGSYSYPLCGSAHIGGALSSTTLREIIVQNQGSATKLVAALGIVSTPAKRIGRRANALPPRIMSSGTNASPDGRVNGGH